MKFRTDRPPRVHITSRRDGDSWVIAVADNGIGIESQYLRRIFGLGERLHGVSKYPGNGIGLATCETIVQRHGGRIWADSAGPDQGSTFTFTMPACAVARRLACGPQARRLCYGTGLQAAGSFTMLNQKCSIDLTTRMNWSRSTGLVT